MSRGEVEEVARCMVIGMGREWDPLDFEQLVVMIPSFTLPVFITFLESRYLQDCESAAISMAIQEVFETFVDQVLEKVRKNY